jgi:hypothetical protein
MHRFPIAMVIAIAGLAFAAPPVFAKADLNGPNCEGWVVSQAVPGTGAKESAASLGLSVREAQELILAACANVTSNTPRCEQGHDEAAQGALERGDLDQYLFHLGALFHCFIGEPVGPPL